MAATALCQACAEGTEVSHLQFLLPEALSQGEGMPQGLEEGGQIWDAG